MHPNLAAILRSWRSEAITTTSNFTESFQYVFFTPGSFSIWLFFYHSGEKIVSFSIISVHLCDFSRIVVSFLLHFIVSFGLFDCFGHHLCMHALSIIFLQDFMIQGGDPTGTGSGGNSIYGFALSLLLLLPPSRHPQLHIHTHVHTLMLTHAHTPSSCSISYDVSDKIWTSQLCGQSAVRVAGLA